MTEFVEAIGLRLLQASISLAISSIVLTSLARLLNPMSHRLIAISSLVPLLLGSLLVSFEITVPQRATQFLEAETSRPNPVFPNRDLTTRLHHSDLIVTSEADAVALSDSDANQVVHSLIEAIPMELVVWGCFTVWVLGLLCKLGQATWAYYGLFRLSRTDFQPARDKWRLEWERLQARPASPIAMYESTKFGPAMCRLPAGYAFVVPVEAWKKLASTERETVMRHELAHFQFRHVPKIAACRILAALHWFNPLAKFCAVRFELACEWQADDQAVANNEQLALSFANAVVRCATIGESKARIWANQLSAKAGSLKLRIVRLFSTSNEKELSRMRYLTMVAFCGVAFLGSVVRFTSAAQNPRSFGEETVSENLVGSTPPEVDQLATVQDSSAKDFTEFGNEITIENETVQTAGTRDTGPNVFKLLFDAIAADDQVSQPVSLELIRNCMDTSRTQPGKTLPLEGLVHFKSIRNIRRTERPSMIVVYEFDVDPLNFFQEFVDSSTGVKGTSDEVLTGFLKDPNGPRLDARKILSEEFDRRVRLSCRFAGERGLDYLVEMTVVHESTFQHNMRRFFGSEPRIESNAARDYFVVPPSGAGPLDQPWVATVRNNKLYWGTKTMVDAAVTQ